MKNIILAIFVTIAGVVAEQRKLSLLIVFLQLPQTPDLE